MTIRHLVVIGGGPNVFIHYGVLKKLVKENFIKSNLKNTNYTDFSNLLNLFGKI